MNSKIMFLWGFIIFLICGSLLVLGNIGNDYNLYKLERNIKISAKNYLIKNDRMPKAYESEIVFVDELIENKIIKDNKDIDKYCIKQVRITNKLIMNKYEVIKECEEELKSSE